MPGSARTSSRSAKFASRSSTRSPNAAAAARVVERLGVAVEPEHARSRPRSRIASACRPRRPSRRRRAAALGREHLDDLLDEDRSVRALRHVSRRHVLRLASHRQQLRELVVVLGPELLLGERRASAPRSETTR
jgi:hypothetical protein